MPPHLASAPPSEGRTRPDQSRLSLLVIRSARPTIAEVPLADLSLRFQTKLSRRLRSTPVHAYPSTA